VDRGQGCPRETIYDSRPGDFSAWTNGIDLVVGRSVRSRSMFPTIEWTA
jgi:hypothetical protein